MLSGGSTPLVPSASGTVAEPSGGDSVQVHTDGEGKPLGDVDTAGVGTGFGSVQADSVASPANIGDTRQT
jgi:hypothetical protein